MHSLCCAVLCCVLQAIGVTNVSRAFWRADVTKEPLQRVYGITFPDKAQLKEYQRREYFQLSDKHVRLATLYRVANAGQHSHAVPCANAAQLKSDQQLGNYHVCERAAAHQRWSSCPKPFVLCKQVLNEPLSCLPALSVCLDSDCTIF